MQISANPKKDSTFGTLFTYCLLREGSVRRVGWDGMSGVRRMGWDGMGWHGWDEKDGMGWHGWDEKDGMGWDDMGGMVWELKRQGGREETL